MKTIFVQEMSALSQHGEDSLVGCCYVDNDAVRKLESVRIKKK